MIVYEKGNWYFVCKKCKPEFKSAPLESRKLAEFAEAVHRHKF